MKKAPKWYRKLFRLWKVYIYELDARRLKRELGMIVLMLVLGGWVAQQYVGLGQYRIWHDTDGDGKADVAVIYVIQIKGESQRLVEVERTTDQSILDLANGDRS